MIGMGGSLLEKDVTVMTIINYLNYLNKNIKEWEKGKKQAMSNIRVPDLSNVVSFF